MWYDITINIKNLHISIFGGEMNYSKLIVWIGAIIIVVAILSITLIKQDYKTTRLVETAIGTKNESLEKNNLFTEKDNTFDVNNGENSFETQFVEDYKAESHKHRPIGIAGVKKTFIPVPIVIQTPELPNGCEITSLTSVLNYYGHPISKLTMADTYLPKERLIREGDKRYGPDPYKAYAGNPREQPGGWFSYPPPIIEAANKYALEVGSDLTATDISGSTEETIYSYLDKGIPVIIWVTKQLESPKVTSSWNIHDTGEHFAAPVNLHVVVLNGHRGNYVYAMNPLKGQVIYNADAFFESYESLGSHAMVVEQMEL